MGRAEPAPGSGHGYGGATVGAGLPAGRADDGQLAGGRQDQRGTVEAGQLRGRLGGHATSPLAGWWVVEVGRQARRRSASVMAPQIPWGSPRARASARQVN